MAKNIKNYDDKFIKIVDNQNVMMENQQQIINKLIIIIIIIIRFRFTPGFL